MEMLEAGAIRSLNSPFISHRLQGVEVEHILGYLCHSSGRYYNMEQNDAFLLLAYAKTCKR